MIGRIVKMLTLLLLAPAAALLAGALSYQPYAIGGCREATPDGWIIGSFTDVTGGKKDGAPVGHVHFFRIPARRTP